MQTCPRCGSTRVRRGYGRERFGLRLIRVRELLCNHCNLSFTRFVLPGMMPKSSHRSKKRNEPEVKETSTPVSTPAQSKRHRPRNKHSKRCPRCDGKNVHRSSRKGLRERAISMFSLYPYRCHDCDQRCYVRRYAQSYHPAEKVPLPL